MHVAVVQVTLPTPISLDSISIEHTGALHGRLVVARRIPTAPLST
jgi:hypothetical protein